MDESTKISRRTALALGVGLALAPKGLAQGDVAKTDDLNIALIGCGVQGLNLMDSLLRISGIRFVAVCDIWPYSLTRATSMLRKYGDTVRTYEDYRELLDRENGLDAVFIATPDWMHAEQTIACLEAGLHVYCESPISNSVEEARAMVCAARQTGKLLQIGHQRRSNPRYINAIDVLHHREKAFGSVRQALMKWPRDPAERLGWPKKYTMDATKLNLYGYESMDHFRNWRCYRKYSAGPLAELGAQQIDVCNWVFGTNPSSVMAMGGIDCGRGFGTENYDSVTSIFEYETADGRARAVHQLQHASSYWAFHEAFMGIEGALLVSEFPYNGNMVAPEKHSSAKRWEEFVEAGLLKSYLVSQPTSRAVLSCVVNVRSTPCLVVVPGPTRRLVHGHRSTGRAYPLVTELNMPVWQPHVENFVDAIRTGAPLRCPGETAYAAAVAMLRANDAVGARKTLEFSTKDFQV